MNSKQRNVLLVVVLLALVFIVFDCLKGKAGSLQPYAPPQPTMVTLSQLDAKIDALSTPVNKVIRGVILFGKNVATEVTGTFSPAVDPSRCVVLLSDPIAFNRDSNPTYRDWISRTGACLINLTETQITVQVELQSASQKLSYQIIEYK